MSVSNFYRPLWKEGMFLAPQHLQQSENYRDAIESVLTHASPPYPWGISSIEIDTNQFSNFQFVVNGLRAITHSNEILCYPGNVEIPSRSFEGFFSDPQQKLMVYLGIPVFEQNSPNLQDDSRGKNDGERYRYRCKEMQAVDENSGESERSIELRITKGRLFFEGEDTQGYQLLPLASLGVESNMNGAMLDTLYIPPLLSVSGWDFLSKLIQGLAAKLTALQSNLMRSLGSKRIVEWCADPRGAELMFKVQAVNQAFFVVQQIGATPGVTPYEAYTELMRVVGMFWAFKAKEQISKLPFYEHLKIGACFTAADEVLRKLISIIDVQSYVFRKFKPAQGRMEVDLDSEWIPKDRKLYIRVSGAGDYGEVIKKLSGVKLCAPSHYTQVLQRRIQALQIQWLRRSPGSLPASEGTVYAEVIKEGPFWPGVEKELAFALGTYEELPYQFELYVE